MSTKMLKSLPVASEGAQLPLEITKPVQYTYVKAGIALWRLVLPPDTIGGSTGAEKGTTMEDETETETPAETPLETRVNEAENVAETALDLMDNVSTDIAALQATMSALDERVTALESELGNASTSGETSGNGSGLDGSDAAGSTGDNHAETGTTAQDIIKPRREHWYFRKLW